MADTQNTKKTTLSRRKQSANADLSSFLFGKVQPQARDLEEAVLGAMMLEKDAVSNVVDILKPDSFYVEAHQKIFESIQALFSKSQPVDVLTVTEELRSSGNLEMVGGAWYITELTNRVASAANVEFHARIISQKYIQRELIRLSSKIIEDAYEDTTDVFELLDKTEQNIFDITEQNLRRSSDSMPNLVKKALTQLEALKDKEDGMTGVPSGFRDLDKVTNGWQKPDLVIVAARPGMGKTSFVMSMVRNAAVDHKKSIAVFSLEMSSVQLVNRLISSEAELPAEKLRKGNLEPHEWQQLHSKTSTLVDSKIFIDDTPAINIFELRAKCRRLKASHDIEMVIIDYLQLMNGTGDQKGNREQEISMISRSLKSIAKELDIPVIALSQLSRAVETRGGDKRPMLSDLRESGAIEQDADMVMFIYRPEYYQIEMDEEGNDTKGMAEIIIAKHRNGPLETVRLRFINQYARFADMEMSDMSFYGERTVPSSMNDEDEVGF